jgi:DNA repair exonuclease SbcCD ATPase subunit
VEHLRGLVARLEAELRWYQLQLGVSAEAAKDVALSAEGSKPELSPWMADRDVMSPLLMAYDRRIQELEEVGSRLLELEELARDLGVENRQLRSQLVAISAATRTLPRPEPKAVGGLEDAKEEADPEAVVLLEKEVAALRASESHRQAHVAKLSEELERRGKAFDVVKRTANEMREALASARQRVAELEESSRRAGGAAQAAGSKVEGLASRLLVTQREMESQGGHLRDATERIASLERTLAALSMEAARTEDELGEQVDMYRVSVCVEKRVPSVRQVGAGAVEATRFPSATVTGGARKVPRRAPPVVNRSNRRSSGRQGPHRHCDEPQAQARRGGQSRGEGSDARARGG